jgi:hypothetical protein
MAIGDNKVFLVPSNRFDAMFVWDLSTGGPWTTMTAPYDENPGSTGAAWVRLPLPADMNCDGVVNGEDIQGFVLALLDPGTYATTAPGWDCTLINADVNVDGARDELDIIPFVEALLGE